MCICSILSGDTDAKMSHQKLALHSWDRNIQMEMSKSNSNFYVNLIFVFLTQHFTKRMEIPASLNYSYAEDCTKPVL